MGAGSRNVHDDDDDDEYVMSRNPMMIGVSVSYAGVMRCDVKCVVLM